MAPHKRLRPRFRQLDFAASRERVDSQQVGVRFRAGRIYQVVGPGVYSDVGWFARLEKVSIESITFSVSDPEVVTAEVPVRRLPPDLDGLRVVQMSDLHVGSFIRLADVDRVVGLINSLSPDLFVFTGTLGTNTSGSFTRYFDGSDVGLGGSGSRDTDAAGLTSGGDLAISIVGNSTVGGIATADEDVLDFTGTFGNSTSGSFTMRLDLTALGIISTADVGSLHVID